MYYIITSNNKLYGPFKFKLDASNYSNYELKLYNCHIVELTDIPAKYK